MLIVEAPNNRVAERTYIVGILLKEFLGLDYRLIFSPVENTTIYYNRDDERSLTLSDAFFCDSGQYWLTPQSLPTEPLKHFEPHEILELPRGIPKSVPALYGEPNSDGTWLTKEEHHYWLGIDILGSSFFMLTRYEELIVNERDARDRFPARASIGYRENFLAYPIVNVYLEILWSLLKSLWPGLPRLARQYEVVLSHDVDTPLCTVGQGGLRFLKTLSGDFVKRRGYSVALRRMKAFRTGKYSEDPCYTFDRIMDLSERHSLVSSFYFIAGDSGGDIDRYGLQDPHISSLMLDIHSRGHRLGLHPSYNSYKDPDIISREFTSLSEACETLDIRQSGWGGRQHYLRWAAGETWRHWDYAGLTYDSSVGYADIAGFRAGCCYPYSTFDVSISKPLNLVERPLIVMDGTLLAPHHMGLTEDDALRVISELALQCHHFHGEFTMLWHNNSLVGRTRERLYSDSIEVALAPDKLRAAPVGHGTSMITGARK